MTEDHLLRTHLVTTRLAGDVATSPRSTLANCAKLVAGHPEYRFGLPDWEEATLRDAVAAIREVCGGDPAAADDVRGPGWIDPDRTLAAIATHRRVLAEVAATRDATVILATGHPTGLLGHYAALARWLADAGCRVLTPVDDTWIAPLDDGRRRGVRYVEGVACVHDGANLRHTHRSDAMEAVLDGAEAGVDLVIADHGMAGAAIAAGIRTLSIADVNDPALPLAQVLGRTDAVLPIDDNLAPSVFLPVTRAMTDAAPSAAQDT